MQFGNPSIHFLPELQSNLSSHPLARLYETPALPIWSALLICHYVVRRRKSMALPLNNHHMRTREIYHGETISNWNTWCKRDHILSVSWVWQRRSCWIILSSAESGFSGNPSSRLREIPLHKEAHRLINPHVFISPSEHGCGKFLTLTVTESKFKVCLLAASARGRRELWSYLRAATYKTDIITGRSYLSQNRLTDGCYCLPGESQVCSQCMDGRV